MLPSVRDHSRPVATLSKFRQHTGNTQWYGRIYGKSKCLDLRRILDTRIQHALEEHESRCQKRTKQGRDDDNEFLLRCNRLRHIGNSRIHDADVANSARSCHIQLLRLIEKSRIELIAYLQVPGEPQQLLLRIRQLTDLALKTSLAALKP